MDYNYRATARKINWSIDNVSGDNLKDFPIERARARGSGWLLLMLFVWMLQPRTSASSNGLRDRYYIIMSWGNYTNYVIISISIPIDIMNRG